MSLKRKQTDGSGAPEGALLRDGQDLSCLADKAASEPDVIRWVADNVDNPVATPADCPSPFAWTLLKQCRENPVFLCTFVEKIWTRLLPRTGTAEDDSGKDKIDGQPTIELLDKIAGIRDEANEGRGVDQMEDHLIHNQEAAGSSPAPAIPGAFEEYDPGGEE